MSENRACGIKGYYRTSDIQRFESIIENIPEDVETILDVGARDNQFKGMLENKGYRAAAVDIAPHDADVLKANVVCLPFKDDAFDLITAQEVLEHLDKEELALALRELERVTKKYIIISVPNEEIPLGVGHKQFFNDKMVKNLLRHKCTRIFHFGNRLAYQGVRKYLCRIDTRLLYLFNIVFGNKKREMDNWIVAIFRLKEEGR